MQPEHPRAPAPLRTPAPRADLLLPLDGVLSRPPGRPAYYVLERRAPGSDEVIQRGVLGSLALHGVESGHVLRHQQVIEDLVRHQARLLKERGGTAQPLLLAAPDLGAFGRCVEEAVGRPPDHESIAPDGGRRRVWVSAGPWDGGPPALPPVLLADGHHRLAAARLLHRRHPGAVADRLPALVVDHGRYPLTLAAVHRELPGLDAERAAVAAARVARVDEHPAGPFPPPGPGAFLLTGGGRGWSVSEITPAAMAARMRFQPPEWVELPAAVSDRVLIPALCEDQGVAPAPRYTIGDPAPGTTALVLPPPTWDQVWAGAAGGSGMPPKSTALGPPPPPLAGCSA
ncbi:DUF1015 family protein [Streptomyces sp. DSM 44917]|uniref:DUF1015 family protein n=1 Tax=Streptomyces boetiae TaxID=3075541 RepID=A0ABU2L9A2_9ACTN|nr:DUF1015 family protein [Streptomyces sp. DSM 44917]MDT0307858.1 DUF1015 family protein [Streptomyces sp. DSM 44917]